MPDLPLGNAAGLDPEVSTPAGFSRRGFLQTAAAGLIGLSGAAAVAAEEPAFESLTGGPLGEPPERGNVNNRREHTHQLRIEAADHHYHQPFPDLAGNGDEELYAENRAGSYSKGLPKRADGTVDPAAYSLFRDAVLSGNFVNMENIVTGGPVRQTSPLGALTFRLEGHDSAQFELEAAPTFASAWAAAEEVELYWRALTRDVPFTEFETSPLVAQAVADLNAMSDYRGPRESGVVTPRVLFRGFQSGAQKGPFLSQFLLKPYYFGNTPITQRSQVPVAGQDFLTSWNEWWAIQNGVAATRQLSFDPTLRYLRNGRDLGEWLHRDFSYQGPLIACLILLSYGADALDPGNPCAFSTKQAGFTSLGGPDALDLVAKPSKAALNAAWYQKWQVHRRLRPEEYGGRVHATRTGIAEFPVHPDVLGATALHHVWDRYQSFLLPQAYPEGCPTHPAFPGGHSTFSAAGCTMLKAFFNENFVIPDPVVPNADGTALVPWEGEPLTVGDELDKLTSNIAHGRDGAGVHWRSDCEQGMRLGEKVAIQILKDLMHCYAEPVRYTLRTFDGETIEV